MVRRAVVVVLLLPFLLALASPAAHAQTPRRGGVIRIAEREAPGLDPHLSISFLTHSYVSLAYSQLVRFPNGPEQKHPADFTILPDLAAKWTVSKDGKVYTFSLRKGVHFHNKPPVNGRELVAAGLRIDFLHEFPHCLWKVVAFMEPAEGGGWRLPSRFPRLPMMFSIRATRPIA